MRRWDKRLWGVLFHGHDKRDQPMLLGAMWHDEARKFEGAYAGEPTRALLFCSRREARTWCSETMEKWRDGRQRDDAVTRWRVEPVRVRETVQVEPPHPK